MIPIRTPLPDDERAKLERLVWSLPDDVDHPGPDAGPALRTLRERYRVGVGDLWHVRGEHRVAAAVAAAEERRPRPIPGRPA